MTKVVTVVGARPQLVKASAVSIALREADVAEVLVHSGQHYDELLSGVFFDELDIPSPAYHLGVSGGSHGVMTGMMLERLDDLLLAEQPDWVLVYGDTNTTLAAALSAAKLHFRVCHVEAGLRSYNRRMPEEINRVVTDHISDLLLCPSKSAAGNLASEGIVDGVHVVGDVMFDVTLRLSRRAKTSTVVRDLEINAPYAVATVHRAESTDSPEVLGRIFDYLRARRHRIVMPLHPRTRAAADKFGLDLSGLQVIAPLGYIDMLRLVSGASEVLTDSGGLQKEAYFLGVECVTLRSETEWVETISHGWNRLWTTDSFATRSPIEEYGSGDAAAKVVDCLLA